MEDVPDEPITGANWPLAITTEPDDAFSPWKKEGKESAGRGSSKLMETPFYLALYYINRNYFKTEYSINK